MKRKSSSDLDQVIETKNSWPKPATGNTIFTTTTTTTIEQLLSKQTNLLTETIRMKISSKKLVYKIWPKLKY